MKSQVLAETVAMSAAANFIFKLIFKFNYIGIAGLYKLLQNIILNTILLCKEGVDKDHLYKKIWKRDKSIQINKLDTHLTNLKNQLAKEIGFELNFSSKLGILKLCID